MRAYISETVETDYLPKALCIHGLKVMVKGRTLRRRTTILKHSRFLRNLVVSPIFPSEPEPVVVEDEENKEEEDEES